MPRGIQRALFAALLMTTPTLSLAKEYTITVTARDHDYIEAPVRAIIEKPTPADFGGATLRRSGVILPAQSRKVGDKAEVLFIVDSLKKGESVKLSLTLEPTRRNPPEPNVKITETGKNLDIKINGEPFTVYDTTTGPNKPYFYPIFAPGGKRVTRRYPIELVSDEERDHPHHRGMWFTHGEVSGDDYWSEAATAAATYNRSFEEIISGPVYGYFRARTDWIGNDGKKDAEDTREVWIYNVKNGRIIDIDTTVRATTGPVVFGDTKEGAFGIRLPDTMRVKGGGGHIENSKGVKDADTWGKRAEWVDYYGPVEGQTVGVAILDHPLNLRHPTYWHVRDYGLFAVNPFGIHDFEKGQTKGVGDFTIPNGGLQIFRYRVFLHRGTTSEANLPAAWAAYSSPPTVEVQ